MQKRTRNSRIVDDGGDESPLKTPTKRELLRKVKHNNSSPNSKLVRDLNKHILQQNNVIAELRRKLEIIRDVSSDASNADTRHMLKNASIKCKDTNVNITEKKDGLEVDVDGDTDIISKSKNVINFHFS